MVRQWQDMNYGGRHSASTYADSLPDFVKLAESYGHVGMKVTKQSQLRKTLDKAFAMKDRLVFVDVITDQEENVYPMIKSGQAHNEMHLSPTGKDTELA